MDVGGFLQGSGTMLTAVIALAGYFRTSRVHKTAKIVEQQVEEVKHEIVANGEKEKRIVRLETIVDTMAPLASVFMDDYRRRAEEDRPK